MIRRQSACPGGKTATYVNPTLLLISADTCFLKRQIDNKAAVFPDNGGFSERMDRMRRKKRTEQPDVFRGQMKNHIPM